MIKLTDEHVGHIVRAKNGFEGLLTKCPNDSSGYSYNVHFDNFAETYTSDGMVFLDGRPSIWDIVEVLPKGNN